MKTAQEHLATLRWFDPVRQSGGLTLTLTCSQPYKQEPTTLDQTLAKSTRRHSLRYQFSFWDHLVSPFGLRHTVGDTEGTAGDIFSEAEYSPLPAPHPHGPPQAHSSHHCADEQGLTGVWPLVPSLLVSMWQSWEDLSPWLLLFQASQSSETRSSFHKQPSPFLYGTLCGFILFSFLPPFFSKHTPSPSPTTTGTLSNGRACTPKNACSFIKYAILFCVQMCF